MGTIAYLERAREARGAPESGRSDAELVQRARAGSASAFEALFRRHAPSMNRLAFRLTHDEADADDLVQDAFVQGFDALDRLRDPAAVGVWLRSILVRTAARRSRRRRIARRLGIRVGGGADVSTVVAADAPPEVVLELRQMTQVLARAPREAGVALILHRVEGLTLAEIADLLGVSEPTIKRRIRAAEQILRAREERA